jgi:hypothetical protein
MVSPANPNNEWDIYQISVSTKTFTPTCLAEVLHNNFFLCGSPQGSLDTATGPPDIVVRASDFLEIAWTNGTANDLATVGVWYNENPTGQTTSTAH